MGSSCISPGLFQEAPDSGSRPRDPDVDALWLVDKSPAGLFVLDANTQRVLYANPALAALYDRSAHELKGAALFDLVAPEDRDRVRDSLRRRLQGEEIAPYEVRGVRKDGTVFDALVAGRKIEIKGVVAVLATVTDLGETKRVALENKEKTRKLSRLESLVGKGLFDVEFPEGKLTPSSALRELLRLPDTDPAAVSLDACPWIPLSDLTYVSAFWRNAIPNEAFEFQHRLACADGKQITVRHRGILEEDGLRGVGYLEDISAWVDAQHRLQELTYRDEVTGLLNRTSLLNEIALEMTAARRNSTGETATRMSGLLAIRVPTILDLNNAIGHGAGEALAMAIANRLQTMCGEEDRLARIAEAEFAILLDPERPSGTEALYARARGLRSALQRPALIGATEIAPQCSVGIARFSPETTDSEVLLEQARTASLHAQSAAGSAIAFSAAEDSKQAIRFVELESALYHAVERSELRLLYQPQADLASGKIVGVEALLRWESTRFGEVSPAEFLPIAERSDAIFPIGEWVLREACRQALTWRRAELPASRIAINLFPRQLNQPNFAGRVHALVLECDCDPSWFCLEVTESAIMNDAHQDTRVLHDLKALGFEIALDDFGTGHSSLSRVHQLPIDVVKIDRSLIPDVLVSPESASITRAIITMSHSLQLRVLAEGVETEDQLKLLAANGCDMVQGTYFSAPVAPAEVESMLRESRRLPVQFLRRSKADRTLLLVDDEENILSSLRRLLRKEGYRIVVAHSAADALKCLTETHVDVILSDQRMPGMTGVELLRRAKELYPDTVRMVLSGFTDLQSVIDAVNEGAIYKFLTKPWDDDKLCSRIADAFREKEMADENRRLARELETANANLANVNEQLRRAVSQKSDHANVLARAAHSIREILETLPASVIGVDADGLVAFAHSDPSRFDPEVSTAIGAPVDTLPAPLRSILQQPDGAARAVEIGTSRYLAFRRSVRTTESGESRLLVLLPAETFAAAFGQDPRA